MKTFDALLALRLPALSFDSTTRPLTLLEAVQRQLERDRGELPSIVLRASEGLTGAAHPLIVARRIVDFEAYEREMLAEPEAIRH